MATFNYTVNTPDISPSQLQMSSSSSGPLGPTITLLSGHTRDSPLLCQTNPTLPPLPPFRPGFSVTDFQFPYILRILASFPETTILLKNEFWVVISKRFHVQTFYIVHSSTDINILSLLYPKYADDIFYYQNNLKKYIPYLRQFHFSIRCLQHRISLGQPNNIHMNMNRCKDTQLEIVLCVLWSGKILCFWFY